MTLIQWLDLAGVAVFAATGALAASRKQTDIIGFLFLGAVTGIGGGTLRDLILGQPVFWIAEHAYVLVCVGVAVIVYFTAHLVESRYKLLLWLDAAGVGAFSVLGAFKGLDVTGSPVIAVVMGILTACFGGILRDLLTGEPSVLMRPEIYVTAALVGATIFTAGMQADLPLAAAAMVAIGAGFMVRAGALRFGWTIPTYRSRPGRRPEDIP